MGVDNSNVTQLPLSSFVEQQFWLNNQSSMIHELTKKWYYMSPTVEVPTSFHNPHYWLVTGSPMLMGLPTS